MPNALPVAADSERMILGGILWNPECFDEAAALLSSDDFSLSSHRLIFNRISQLASEGKPIDESVIIGEMLAAGELDKAGGAEYLVNLKGHVIPRKSVGHHAKTVREFADKRRLARTLELAQNKLSRSDSSLSSCIGDINEAVLHLASGAGSREYAKSVQDVTEPVLDELLAMRTGKGLIGLPTGLRDLDATTTGVREGELWVIGALPARGKTSLALQIACANAREGTPVAMFSLEMKTKQCLTHVWLNESRYVPGVSFSAWKLRDPSLLLESEIPEVRKCAQQVSSWPLYIDESSNLKVQELVARARMYIRRYGCKLIIVDYLRLVGAPQKDIRERIAHIADCLRQLAKDTGVPVVALSQLRRPQSINEKPSMIDLKESGDVEAAAHTVLLIYRPVSEFGTFTGEDEIIVGKQREGETGPIPVRFNDAFLTFDSRTLRR